jgi:hypothetical protein
MRSRSSLVAGVVWAAMATTACDSDSQPPPSPTPTPTPTLTLTAPVAVSPVEATVTNSLTPVLVLRAATGSDTTAAVSYEIQVLVPGGDVAYTRTVTGGPANGQATVSHQVESPLTRWSTYRWRARATAGSTTGPFSDTGQANATFVTTRPDATTSNDEFREFFFDLITRLGVGPNATQQALATMEPDLSVAGVILAKDPIVGIRGRIYLPTGAPNKYLRSVDVVTAFGAPWVWIFRGATICEGICP